MTYQKNKSDTSAQHSNKYLKWYYELCQSRKYRGVSKKKGFHVHHIIPKCDGGDDSKENRVRFTPREHFIAHLLLAKGTNSPKHWYTIRRMLTSKQNKNGAINYKVKNSKLYEKLYTTAFALAGGGATKGRPKSKAMREKLSKTKKGKPIPKETREKAWKANRGRKQSEEERKKRSESAKAYWRKKKGLE